MEVVSEVDVDGMLLNNGDVLHEEVDEIESVWICAWIVAEVKLVKYGSVRVKVWD